MALRSKRDQLRAELARVERRLTAIVEHKPDHREPVAERVKNFLRKYAGETFSPRELMEAVGGGEDSVRKALTYLVVGGFLVKTAHATYTFEPHTQAPDWESNRQMRGWEDP